MMHGPHPHNADAFLAKLPDELRWDIDHVLRSCDGDDGYGDNYLIGLLLLKAIGPVRFAALKRR